MPVPDLVYIYHITHVDNLPNIIASGGLLANNSVADGGYVNIAHESIQRRRHSKQVPCGPGGLLHDYAPFYLGRKSPMLYAISKGTVEGYEQGQEPVIYLVSKVEAVTAAELPFVFTDGHAAMDLTDFYDDLANLGQIDWPLLDAKYWFDNDDFPDRARPRQAEFLIHQCAPWEIMAGIAVKTDAMKCTVERILADLAPAHKPRVLVKTNWYY